MARGVAGGDHPGCAGVPARHLRNLALVRGASRSSDGGRLRGPVPRTRDRPHRSGAVSGQAAHDDATAARNGGSLMRHVCEE